MVTKSPPFRFAKADRLHHADALLHLHEASRLDRLSDFERGLGHTAVADFLAQRAEAIREGAAR